jgi:nucleotide-binding universal stress UspA family protein
MPADRDEFADESVWHDACFQQGALSTEVTSPMTTRPTAASTQKPYEIVVGLDFSELSERAFYAAVDLARERGRTELHAIVVGAVHGDGLRLPGSDQTLDSEQSKAEARARVRVLVDRYRAVQGRVPLDRVAVYVVSGDPAAKILALAEAIDADLVVVGTHGRTGVGRLILGSVAEQVVRKASTGVYVVRPRDFVRGEKIPQIEPPLEPGQPHLKPFVQGRTYHYVDRNSQPQPHTMPVT